MAKPPHISDERGILPDFRGTGFTRKIQVHDPPYSLATNDLIGINSYLHLQERLPKA
jgi:hypothetical protein